MSMLRFLDRLLSGVLLLFAFSSLCQSVDVSRRNHVPTAITANPAYSEGTPHSGAGAGTAPALTLEDRKRALDIQKLEYDLGKGKRLEWVKAIGPWFTAVGIAVTLWLGLSQLKQTQRSRDDERFERSVTRLGSLQPAERLTGLAGLEQFLKGTDTARQQSVLAFIINAAVIERDQTVRDALLDSLGRLRGTELSKDALNAALVTARDRNRALLKRLTDAFWKTIEPGKNWPSGSGLTEVPIGVPDADGREALEASAQAMAALIRAGAYTQDLSRTYCVECELSTKERPAKLAGVNFDGSFLRRAILENADLTNASFHNAALILTRFNSATLKGAKLTADVPVTPWQELTTITAGTTAALYGADFSCSDLSEADLSGRAIFTVLYQDPVIGLRGDNFAEANLTKTRMDAFQLILGFPSDMLEQAGGAQRFDFRKVFPIRTGQWAGPSQPIPSIKGHGDYVLYTVNTGPDFRFEQTFDVRAFWDFVLHMRNLNGARHLDQAIFANGLKEFLENNKALISPSLGKPRC